MKVNDLFEKMTLLELKNAPLFHFTTLEYLEKILDSNILRAHDRLRQSIGNQKDAKPFVSFSRTPYHMFVRKGAAIQIDQLALSQKFKIIPVFGDVRKWVDNAPRENEERIYQDIPNISKYILQIYVDKDIYDQDLNSYIRIVDRIKEKHPNIKIVPVNFVKTGNTINKSWHKEKQKELAEIAGVGIIVKGVNTTKDVDINNNTKQSKKFGFKVDRYGRPPILQPSGKTYKIINEQAITDAQLAKIENYIDKLFLHLGIDVAFTHHFLDRLNDMRNVKQITVKELIDVFVELYKKHGNKLVKMRDGIQAVVKDLSSMINIPFIIRFNKNHYNLIAKTIMRKKNFHTADPVLPVKTRKEENNETEPTKE